MTFRIADTFTEALTKLTNKEQKSVKTTVFNLQLDPSANGLRMHKLTGGRDKNFWSVSATMDLRVILHRQDGSLLVCYVDHHDKAYEWAANRKLEVHPATGAAQLVEVEEVNREIVIPIYVQKKVEQVPSEKFEPVRKPPLYDKDGSWLMQYGVPEIWVDRLKQASEDELLVLVEHLPGEAAEAVIDIAAGTIPLLPVKVDPVVSDPFEHPDAQRRFRTIESRDELESALEAPWDKWTIFLHPSQRELATKDFSGPARVSGSAGTGKTVVALHRAVNLAKKKTESRVLLTTFSDALAIALRKNLHRLIKHEPIIAERMEVVAMDTLANRLIAARGEMRHLATVEEVNELLLESAELVDHDFTQQFLLKEWENVVDPWHLTDVENYLSVKRLGRRTRLPKARRETAWTIFADVRQQMEDRNWTTQEGVYNRLAEIFRQSPSQSPFDYVVVDEAQDISVGQLRFLAAMVGGKSNGLFFSGDLGQRIFQAPFSWSSLGVDVRGRASTLRINYRTSHQIRSQADKLLSATVSDVDGNVESRSDTQSVFNGPAPTITQYDSYEGEASAAGEWLADRIGENMRPEEIAVFVRSAAELQRAHMVVDAAQQDACELDNRLVAKEGCVVVSTMHLAKGLEFRAVLVIACDEDVIPDQGRIDSIRDQAELEEVYDTERHLLYVACTRARDMLWISCANTPSEFVEDLIGA